jgi:hypothetical protein
MDYCYISIDIETDGPNVLENNMLSIGLYVMDIDENFIDEYYSCIMPLENHIPNEMTMQFWLKPENNNAWIECNTNQRNYVIVMNEIAQLLKKLSNNYKLNFLCMPASFDFMFFKSYYDKSGSNDIYVLTFKAICISTLFDYYKTKNNLSSKEAKSKKLEFMNFESEKEHHALYDAKCQCYLYINLLNQL